MAINSERIVVSDEVVPLNVATTSGQFIAIKNIGTSGVDLGDATVTKGNGFLLAVLDELQLSLKPGEVLYAVRTSAPNTTLAVLRT